MFGPLWNAVSTRYKAAVFSELANHGLRYDDLYDPLKDEVSNGLMRENAQKFGPFLTA